MFVDPQTKLPASFTAGTQGKGEHHAVEENHVIDWDKAKVVDREAQRQTRWIKEALWIRKTPMCMNRDAESYQLSHTWDQVISRSRTPSSCKQSRRDQDVRQTSKRCHLVTYFQLCKVRSFYIIEWGKTKLCHNI